MNEITISGRLVDDFSLRHSQSGEPWGFFRLANNDNNSTLFISVTVGNEAEKLRELKKGDNVTVKGMLRQKEYEKNGEKKTIYDIRAKRVEINGKKMMDDTRIW